MKEIPLDPNMPYYETSWPEMAQRILLTPVLIIVFVAMYIVIKPILIFGRVKELVSPVVKEYRNTIIVIVLYLACLLVCIIFAFKYLIK